MGRHVQPTPISYLILVHPALVAMDIAATLTDHAPQARLICPDTEAEAVLALRSLQTLEAAFVHMAPLIFARTELAMLIGALGGRVILMGEAAEAAGAGPDYAVLPRPFCTDYVLDVLQVPGRTRGQSASRAAPFGIRRQVVDAGRGTTEADVAAMASPPVLTACGSS